MAKNLPIVKAASGNLIPGIRKAVAEARKNKCEMMLVWDNVGRPVKVIVLPKDSERSVRRKVGDELNRMGGRYR